MSELGLSPGSCNCKSAVGNPPAGIPKGSPPPAATELAQLLHPAKAKRRVHAWGQRQSMSTLQNLQKGGAKPFLLVSKVRRPVMLGERKGWVLMDKDGEGP